MTKAELVELIFINVSGGVLSPDIPVRREDIRAGLPVFFTDALTGNQFQDRNLQQSDIALYGATDGHRVNPLFLTKLNLSLSWDTTQAMHTASIPGRIALLPNNRGVDRMDTKKIGQPAYRVNSRRELYNLRSRSIFWFVENDPLVLHVWNMPKNNECDVSLFVVQDIASAEDDDEIIMPPGFSTQLLQAATNYFLQQRLNPEDRIINDRDDNSQGA